MATQLKLNSVVDHGVGGDAEAGVFDLIYSFLLNECGQNFYSAIVVNQIGDDLNEIILREGKRIHINIRYPVYEDFESKQFNEKNRIRLDVIHTSLLKIAEYEKKLDPQKLETIRSKIIEQDFKFHFLFGTKSEQGK